MTCGVYLVFHLYFVDIFVLELKFQIDNLHLFNCFEQFWNYNYYDTSIFYLISPDQVAPPHHFSGVLWCIFHKQ